MRTDDYKQSPYAPAVPDGEFGIACDSSLLMHTWREYAGNRVYEDGVLSRLLFDGGYVSFRDSVPTYHYYIRDYLDKQEEKNSNASRSYSCCSCLSKRQRRASHPYF